jgi:MFS family permease
MQPAAGLIHHPDFRRLWVGDTVSQVGTQLTLVALPVLAVRELGADEVQVGVLAACQTAAFLLIGLPAGAWVDRWDTRRTLISNDLLRAAALATLPLAWWLGALSIWQVYLVALLVGVGTVFFDVAYQSYLPSLVPRERLVEGNGMLQASASVAAIGGPALGGQLLRVLAAPAVIALDAVSFVVSAAWVARIGHRDPAHDRATRRPLQVEVREGLSFVVHQPLLRRIVACTAISNFFGSIVSTLLPLYVLRDLGLSEGTLGLVFSVGAGAGLLAALTARRVAARAGEGRAIVLAALVLPVGYAFAPLASTLPALPALIAGWVVLSFAIVGYNVLQVSFRQRLCPPALLGRMNASVRFVVWGVTPLGALLGGVLGADLGIVPTLWIATAGTALAVMPVLLSPLARMRDIPDVVADSPG